MPKRKGPKATKAATKQKPQKMANTAPTKLEDGELPEEPEFVEETDSGHSSSSMNTTPEKDHSSPLPAALLPSEPAVIHNITGAQDKKITPETQAVRERKQLHSLPVSISRAEIGKHNTYRT